MASALGVGALEAAGWPEGFYAFSLRLCSVVCWARWFLAALVAAFVVPSAALGIWLCFWSVSVAALPVNLTWSVCVCFCSLSVFAAVLVYALRVWSCVGCGYSF